MPGSDKNLNTALKNIRLNKPLFFFLFFFFLEPDHVYTSPGYESLLYVGYGLIERPVEVGSLWVGDDDIHHIVFALPK